MYRDGMIKNNNNVFFNRRQPIISIGVHRALAGFQRGLLPPPLA
jgi:hypothetical protein